jgi:hypothetical protein
MPTLVKVVATYSDGSTQEIDAAAFIPTEAQVQAAVDAGVIAAFTPAASA